jgi:hypothetical protein
LQEGAAAVFTDRSQRCFVHLTVENQGDDLLPIRQEADRGALHVFGKRGDSIDGALDVVESTVLVRVEQ